MSHVLLGNMCFVDICTYPNILKSPERRQTVHGGVYYLQKHIVYLTLHSVIKVQNTQLHCFQQVLMCDAVHLYHSAIQSELMLLCYIFMLKLELLIKTAFLLSLKCLETKKPCVLFQVSIFIVSHSYDFDICLPLFLGLFWS